VEELTQSMKVCLQDFWSRGLIGVKTESQKAMVIEVQRVTGLSYDQIKVRMLICTICNVCLFVA